MGFFDFLKKGFTSIVKGLDVEHSPIVKSLGSLAGLVAQAVPVIGPIIDVAVPALSAIFSDDPALGYSSITPSTQDPLEQPLTVNLKRSEEDIKLFLKTVSDIKDTLSTEIENVAERVLARIEKLQEYHKHRRYIDFRTEITSRIGYFKEQSHLFNDLTATSGPSAFNIVFNSLDGGPTLPQERGRLLDGVKRIEGDLEDPSYVPSRDMLELYLLAVHWLLIFDKCTSSRRRSSFREPFDRNSKLTVIVISVIICRGLEAKSLFANAQFFAYLHALKFLDRDVDNVRNDARRAYNVLGGLVKRLIEAREKQITVDIAGGEQRNSVSIIDHWPVLSIGWLPENKIKQVLSVQSLSESFTPSADDAKAKTDMEVTAKENFEKSTVYAFYREVAQRSLEAYLEPAHAVMESLADSIRHWNSRLPASPISRLEGKPLQHVAAKTTSDKPGAEDKSPYWGKSVSYAITYVNQFGESPESHWSEQLDIKEDVKAVQLDLHPVVFANDPTAGIEPVKSTDGKRAESNRGIRRRIYLRYKSSHDPNVVIMDHIGTVSEETTAWTHTVATAPEFVPT